VQRNRTGLNLHNKKLFNEAKSPKGVRQRIGGKGRQAGSKQAGQEYTGHKEDRTKDNNPAGDKGKTDTIYRGGNTGVRHETVTRQEWLRAGEGNETIKETQRRHRRDTEHKRHKTGRYTVKPLYLYYNQPLSLST